ncbi:MAG TPA: copper chaperone PCu(A)C [Burkholderiaceae bacterium]|nr:copper chaperone PCu(A)C [Burkholderiaceae bacterium]
MFRKLVIIALLAVLPALASAHDYQLQSLHIDHPFATPTPPGAVVGAAYFRVDNKGAASDRLLSASSPVAGAVAIHEMKMDGDVMRMRPLHELDIKAGQSVTLKPGGLHIMLMQLKHSLRVGDKFPMTLNFEHAGTIEVSVWVEEPHGQGEGEHMH